MYFLRRLRGLQSNLQKLLQDHKPVELSLFYALNLSLSLCLKASSTLKTASICLNHQSLSDAKAMSAEVFGCARDERFCLKKSARN
jgi:hypothetical protein